MIDQSELRRVLRYDPETGLFWWRDSARGRRLNQPAGVVHPATGYRSVWLGSRVSGDGRHYRAHRLAWFYVHGVWPEGDLDHINRNVGDNRIENLRPATDTLNKGNQQVRSDNRLGVKGVGEQNGKWFARIQFKGTPRWLGTYNTPEEAHAVYCRAAHDLFGEFSHGG